MNYSKYFEKETNEETELIKENFYKDMVIAVFSGIIFGVGQFSAIYFCHKLFGRRLK